MHNMVARNKHGLRVGGCKTADTGAAIPHEQDDAPPRGKAEVMVKAKVEAKALASSGGNPRISLEPNTKQQRQQRRRRQPKSISTYANSITTYINPDTMTTTTTTRNNTNTHTAQNQSPRTLFPPSTPPDPPHLRHEFP